ncbi:GNAT family N-acetyltransferase [Shewanella sp. HL-SH8]|uniref:GNAT family N-acetyltransferase n=1 Tax=Shewanella sp. HL-SH8 TaxID=3436242 RepID=UPI003EBCEF56
MSITVPIIRSLTVDDNAAIADVIRQVSAEYGLTPDKGFSVADKTLDTLSQVYSTARSQYWVIELDGHIIGGAGIAPLAGYSDICELQKMYFLPQVRGKGLAKKISHLAFEFAKEQGFNQVYLETTSVLVEALALYQKLGFETGKHLGETGHDACEIAMLRNL